MRKQLCVLMIVGATSAPVYAIENYIALEIGSGSYDISGSNPLRFSQLYSDSEDIGAYALKLGHYFSGDVRAYLFFQQINSARKTLIDNIGTTSIEINTQHFGIGLDYMYYFSPQLYLLTGGNLDLYSTDYEVVADGVEGRDTASGVAAGANLGLGYMFTERFSVELGYRYTYYNDNKSDDNSTLEISSNQIGYLNASYSF